MLIISQNTSKSRTATTLFPSLRMNPDKGACPLADCPRHCEARSNPVSHKMFIPLKKKENTFVKNLDCFPTENDTLIDFVLARCFGLSPSQ
jgi:hypothetical protein